MFEEVQLVEAPVLHEDWWKLNVKYVSFRRIDVQIICAKFVQPNPRACVTLLTGWSETFLKYADIIKVLYDLGFSVYTYDHQCQGLSGRHLPESQSTWIADFQDYVDDLLYFDTHIVKYDQKDNTGCIPNYLLSHSMGGLVSGLVMAEYPDRYDRAILSAPMFFNKCGMKDFDYALPLPQWLLLPVMKLMHVIGGGTQHCIGNSLESSDKLLKTGITTFDESHVDDWRSLRMKHPNIMATCPCNDWLLNAMIASRKFHAIMNKVSTPTIVINADHDYFVENWPMEDFAVNAQHARLLHCPNACHEILFERPLIRSACLSIMTDFLLLNPSTKANNNNDYITKLNVPHPLTEFDKTVLPNSRKGSIVTKIQWIAGVGMTISALALFWTRRASSDAKSSFSLRGLMQ
jgi:lysophospholipase